MLQATWLVEMVARAPIGSIVERVIFEREALIENGD